MKTEQKEVTVRNITGPDGNKLPDQTKAYTKTVYEVDDVLAELSDPKTAKAVCDDLTYARDLAIRASVRNEIFASVDGPGKAIDRLVRGIIKMRAGLGRPVTEEQAKVIALSIQ